MPLVLNSLDIELFHQKIFDFYLLHRRNFPWRETTSRYAVMVSEIMLQQTQTDRVVGKFMTWMERFPDTESLASASLREEIGRAHV